MNEKAGTHDVVWVETPAGLGLARALDFDPKLVGSAVRASTEADILRRLLNEAIALPQPALVISELHFANEASLSLLDDFLSGGPDRDVVLAGAGDPRWPLAPWVTRQVRATPCTTAEFAATVDGAMFETAGGWPEAVGPDGRPSAELRRTVSFLAARVPRASEALAAVSVAPSGIDVELLAHVTESSVVDGLARLDVLEGLGLVCWSGHRVLPAFPLVAAAVFTTGAALRATALRFVDAACEIAPAEALRVCVESDLPPTLPVLGILQRVVEVTECSGDVVRWRETARALAASHHVALRESGLLSLARLAIARGHASSVRDLLADTGPSTGRRDVEVMAAATAMGTVALPLLNASDPRFDLAFPEAKDTDAQAVSGLVLAASGRRSEALTDLAASRPATALDYALHASTLALCGCHDSAWQLLDPSIAGTVTFTDLARCTVLAQQGRFRAAADIFGRVVGWNWDEVSTSHGAVGIVIASGVDVPLARRLLPHVLAPAAGQFGHILVRAALARAAFVTNDPNNVRLHKEVLADAADTCLYGVIAVFAPDVLEAGWGTPLIEDLAALEPLELIAPYVDAAQAILSHDPDRVTHVLRDRVLTPYAHARLETVVGRLCSCSGDVARGRVHLQRARAQLTALGAPVDAARVMGLLGDRTRASLDDLDDRQRQIIELSLEGRRPAQVAAALGVTERTLKRALSPLYARYDVKNRIELVGLFKNSVAPGR